MVKSIQHKRYCPLGSVGTMCSEHECGWWVSNPQSAVKAGCAVAIMAGGIAGILEYAQAVDAEIAAKVGKPE